MTVNHEDNQKQDKKRFTVTGFLWSIVNPVSDLKFIINKGLMPLAEKILMLLGIKNTGQPVEHLTFEQAVKLSRKTESELKASYERRQIFWSLAMYTVAAASLILLYLVLTVPDLPLVYMGRVFAWVITLAAAAAYSYAQALGAVYRHWQLVNKKVSIAEGGTFQDFQKEVRPVLDIISLKYVLKKG